MVRLLLWMVAVFNTKFHIIVLAAGVGRRLRPLTIYNPKPLVMIKGKSMLERLLGDIPKERVKSLSIVIGYHGNLIEKYVMKMNLPYKVKFYRSFNYNKTHCSSSLAIVRDILPNGAMVFNSDIVFNKNVLKDIFKKAPEKVSFVVCKEKDSNIESDLQKILSINGTIQQWSLKLDEYTSEVIGPVYINCFDGKNIKKYIDKNLKIVNKMPCFTFLSEQMVNGKTVVLPISKKDCFEIDTVDDLKYATRLLSI
jgi:choline kinase